MTDKIILIDSDEAATYMTNIKGWVSSLGNYFGGNERIARYDGCTHKYCEICGSVINKNGLTICNACRHEKSVNRYNDMPKMEWSEDSPLYSDAFDVFLFDKDSVYDFIDYHPIEIAPEDMRPG
jgi:hypothetical protein